MISLPAELIRYLSPLHHEEVWIVSVSPKGKPLASEMVAKGNMYGVAISFGQIAEAARRGPSKRFVLVHNHPSGVATPGPEDIDMTVATLNSLRATDMILVDHLVVGYNDIQSVPAPYMTTKRPSRHG